MTPAQSEATLVPELTLKSRDFRKERERSWRELEELVATAEAQGTGALPPLLLQRFPLLYRSALSSLSVARSIALDRALILYLENLCLRAFLAVYAQPIGVRETIRSFATRELPRTVRALKWHVVIAVLLLALGVWSGFALVNRDEGWYSVIVSGDVAEGRGPASTRDELLKVLNTGLPEDAGMVGLIANQLFTHNTGVALLTFGLGLLAGVPTVLLTFMQGLTLGAFVALHHHQDLTLQFVGWVSIHGGTELGALVLFAAAGLRMGELVVFPGPHTRVENFAQHRGEVGRVAIGGALMLLVAATLEGVFRQAIVQTELRLTIGAVMLAFWLAYFGWAGRGERG